MPLMKCQKNGKNGWKFGENGHCYTGPHAKENAKKQMRAIKWRQSQGTVEQMSYKLNEKFIKNNERKIQSFVFPKPFFVEQEVRLFASEHKGLFEERSETYIVTMQAVSAFENNSFDSINLPNGSRAVIGEPKEK